MISHKVHHEYKVKLNEILCEDIKDIEWVLNYGRLKLPATIPRQQYKKLFSFLPDC